MDKMSRRILGLMMALACCVGLCACAGDNSTNSGVPAESTESADNRVALDVFNGLTVKVNPAINGFGKSIKLEYDYSKVDYDKTNADIKEFLKGITFYTEEHSNLRNGDAFVVYATWSKSTADALGIKLLQESKEYTVEGLYDVYRSTAELPVSIAELDDIMEEMDEYIAYSFECEGVSKGYYDTSYRYFAIFENDSAGTPYISQIYVTAVATRENYMGEEGNDLTMKFVCNNFLYQSYWEYRVTPHAERSYSISDAGELFDIPDVAGVEEIFRN